MTKLKVEILYDGDCPFCANYVGMLRLRENCDCVLEDARTRPDLVEKFRTQGMEISDGFIVSTRDRSYHGADALVVLSALSSSSGLLNRCMAFIFGKRWLARLLYPPMKVGRRMVLLTMGRKAQI